MSEGTCRLGAIHIIFCISEISAAFQANDAGAGLLRPRADLTAYNWFRDVKQVPRPCEDRYTDDGKLQNHQL